MKNEQPELTLGIDSPALAALLRRAQEVRIVLADAPGRPAEAPAAVEPVDPREAWSGLDRDSIEARLRVAARGARLRPEQARAIVANASSVCRVLETRGCAVKAFVLERLVPGAGLTTAELWEAFRDYQEMNPAAGAPMSGRRFARRLAREMTRILGAGRSHAFRRDGKYVRGHCGVQFRVGP